MIRRRKVQPWIQRGDTPTPAGLCALPPVGAAALWLAAACAAHAPSAELVRTLGESMRVKRENGDAERGDLLPAPPPAFAGVTGA
jgi:hypothetical protein